MTKQTQEQWLDSNHIASGFEDLGFLDFEKVANAFGFEYLELSKTDEIASVLCD